jgi:hypothetical protein
MNIGILDMDILLTDRQTDNHPPLETNFFLFRHSSCTLMQQGDHLFDVQWCAQEHEPHQESPPANQNVMKQVGKLGSKSRCNNKEHLKYEAQNNTQTDKLM